MKDLTVRQIEALAPGVHRVSRNLYVQVRDGGPKSWLFRYMRDGKARWMGLGSLELVSLAKARDKTLKERGRLLEGVDPLDAKEAERTHAKLTQARAMTFQACATAYIKAHAPGWRNDKHRAQWPSTLEQYVYPVLGALPVQSIDTGLVMQVLEPIWHAKSETASRVRGRIESVLDWATARGYRQGDNPARWRGHIQNLLPAKTKVREVEHHKAVPYAELGDFMAELRDHKGIAARALEFVILTAARSGDVRGARWCDIDFDKGLWIVPQTKSGKPHKVPLSDAALALLQALPREGESVFIGARAGKPLSDMALLAVMRRMGRAEKPHGFRSTFSDWCAEQTAYPAEVREMALAHAVSDKVEAAYRRGDLFAKRARLMADWARFCASPSAKGEVVPLRA